MEKIQIILNSKTADQYLNNNTTDCIFIIPIIEVKRRHKAHISLTDVVIPYSFYNVNETNDKLNYGVVQPGDDVADGVPLVRSGDLSDSTPDLSTLRRVSSPIDHKHRKSRLKGNEILIACVGSIGRVGWVSEDMIGWNIARAVTRIPVRQGVNREYIYRYLQNPVVQGYFERETRAVAQPTLNVGLIAKTPVALPPLELQNEFLQKYRVAMELKKRASSFLINQGQLFASLSQKAFAGQL